METPITDQPSTEIKQETAVDAGQAFAAVIPSLSHDELMKCLYFLYDAFDRVGITFFLVKDTARLAMQQDKLRGDHIDVGVRHLEWVNESKSVLFDYFSQEHVEITAALPNSIAGTYDNIPFVIHLYEDSDCLRSPQMVRYEYESWFVPNQLERFEKEFNK